MANNDLEVENDRLTNKIVKESIQHYSEKSYLIELIKQSNMRDIYENHILEKMYED